MQISGALTSMSKVSVHQRGIGPDHGSIARPHIQSRTSTACPAGQSGLTSMSKSSGDRTSPPGAMV